MVYYYKKESICYITRQENEVPEDVEELVEMERAIPIPNKVGYIAVLNIENGNVFYELEKTEEQIKIDRIEELKNQLLQTDYKIIKCTEYELAGIESEYDINQIHTERQAIRDEINELETSSNENDNNI